MVPHSHRTRHLDIQREISTTHLVVRRDWLSQPLRPLNQRNHSALTLPDLPLKVLEASDTPNRSMRTRFPE